MPPHSSPAHRLSQWGPFNTSSGVKAGQAGGYETGKGGGFGTSWMARLFTLLYSGRRAMALVLRIAPNYSQRRTTSSGGGVLGVGGGGIKYTVLTPTLIQEQVGVPKPQIITHL